VECQRLCARAAELALCRGPGPGDVRHLLKQGALSERGGAAARRRKEESSLECRLARCAPSRGRWPGPGPGRPDCRACRDSRARLTAAQEEKGRPHLSTQHAKLGVACIAFLFFNILGGASIKLSPAAYAKNVKTHRFGGYIAYAVVLANHTSALASGYVTKDETLTVVLWGTLAVQAAFMAAGAAQRLGQLLAKKKAI